MTNQEIRKNLQRLMWDTVEQQKKHHNWFYHEVRPLAVVRVPSKSNSAVFSDCSFGCKLLCYAAGAPDPTGYHYEGYGNSSSIWQHCTHIAKEKVLPGDCVTFGQGGSVHVAMFYAWHHERMWLWNMGRMGEPSFVTYGVERKYHGQEPETWCQILKPQPISDHTGNPPKKGTA